MAKDSSGESLLMRTLAELSSSSLFQVNRDRVLYSCFFTTVSSVVLFLEIFIYQNLLRGTTWSNVFCRDCSPAYFLLAPRKKSWPRLLAETPRKRKWKMWFSVKLFRERSSSAKWFLIIWELSVHVMCPYSTHIHTNKYMYT